MKDRTRQIITNMVSRLQFYLESLGFLKPLKPLTKDQLMNTKHK